jgi:hypothetical protein
MKTLKRAGLYFLTEDDKFIEIYHDEEFITAYSKDEREKAEKEFDELVGLTEIKEND